MRVFIKFIDLWNNSVQPGMLMVASPLKRNFFNDIYVYHVRQVTM